MIAKFLFRPNNIKYFLNRSLQKSYSSSSETMDGASLVAKSLKDQGVEYMFGVVGIPIIEVAMMAQQHGIKYVGMRNEQAASYAASAIGYLTRKPAVCLVVSGPGFVHALAGMSNANENAWPLIVIGGSSDTHHESHGAFQEFSQVSVAKQFTKYAARPSSLSQIPFFVEKAVRTSLFGRPGAVYIDLAAEMMNSSVDLDDVRFLPKCAEAPRVQTSLEKIQEVASALSTCKKPLLILGKGAAYSQAENEFTKLVNNLKIPFLPTPMGKGVVDDDSEFCVSAARSTALKDADLIILAGARLNWMLHFGAPPRFDQNVKIIQIDLHAEELGNNTSNCIQVQADLKTFGQQLNAYLDQNPIESDVYNQNSEWWSYLKQKVNKNKGVIQAMMDSPKVPMNYYAAYARIKAHLPPDSIIVSEGANTMDTSRSVLNHRLPRHRLDAGSFGTMGVGSGFAIASALYCRDHQPNKKVFCIQGDSAFGFGGMEIETAIRYKLPIVFIVFNNNGIYAGLDSETFKEIQEGNDPCLVIPPTSLLPNIRYEKLASAFEGFQGFYASTPQELDSALKSCLSITDKPTIINVAIDPAADRKQQEFPWLTKSKI